LERTIVGIDVGTTKVCTLIGEVDEGGQVCVVGVGVAPSQGLTKGVVVNVEDATKSVAASIEKAERVSGYSIEAAYLGLAGKHIASVNSRGVVAVGRGERYITEDDVARAIEAAQAIAVPHSREIVHVLPRSYILDGQEGVRDPVGMMGFRLEVEAHIVTGAVPSIRNLVQCLENAHVEVNELVLQPLASAEAVLTLDERETGVALVDAGGGTTDVAILAEGAIGHSVVLPVGGNNLTNDLAVGLRTPFSVAEQLKIRYGHALPEMVDPAEMIDVTAFGEAEIKTLPRRELVEILEARCEEICAMVQEEIRRSGFEGLLPAGVVLTGGTADLPGFKELAAEMLQMPVRVGRARNVGGLADAVSNPAYATAVGLLQWGLRNGSPEKRTPKRGESAWSELFIKFKEGLRALLPR
jgi:cell division protein FtsA